MNVNQLHRELDACMARDRHRFKNRIARLKKLKDEDARTTALEKLSGDIKTSVSIRNSRAAAVPEPTYPPDLPIAQHRVRIIESIKNHPVTIICGETGSGKTTQIPKMCIEAGRGVDGFIGHTQPRRIAARSVSSRIASELHAEVGGVVGYKVRFNDQVSNDTYIKLMTDGILLAEIQTDPWLNQYDTIIVDEAHERSLNIDFILGYLKQLLRKRRDIKIIITSATIDPETFSRHFNDAPIVLAEGRSYPVEVRYKPWGEDETDERDQPEAIADACEELAGLGSGDILVFLSGERDIREASDYLVKNSGQSKRLRGVEILPLLARLSQHVCRAIVFAVRFNVCLSKRYPRHLPINVRGVVVVKRREYVYVFTRRKTLTRVRNLLSPKYCVPIWRL